MKWLMIVIVLFGSAAFGQSNPILHLDKSRAITPRMLSNSRILIGNSQTKKANPIRLSDTGGPINVSGTILKEIEFAAKRLYNIENKVVAIKLGDRKKQFLNLTNHVGLKGWETKATGMLSRKRGSTFDLNYRYSVEDMFMNGMGHRLMFTTKF